ncbi:MAG: restriction endonuclease subunit S [Polyangiaceae bacterium]|nr:restriction endonuclease subunit S [Polyangiaceae bacterium]
MVLMPRTMQTEVGIIPTDWEVLSFGEVFNITAGGDVDPKRSKSYCDETYRFPIYSNALTNHGLYGYCSYANHPAGSITITARGSLGFASFRDHAYTAIGRVLVLQPKRDLSGVFFAELVNNRIKFAVESTGVPQLTAPQLSMYKLPIPPLAEQCAIAAALSDVDALIASLDQLIAKKRDLKQAAMQQLLTGQTRLPGFTGDWTRARLESLSTFITKGSTPTTYGFGWEKEGILFLRSECVSDAGLDLTQSMFISAAAHTMLRRSETRDGDILMTITGNVGRVIYLDGVGVNANINQHIARIRVPPAKANARFVYYFLAQPLMRQYYSSITTGQAYPQISLQQVRDTVISLPTIEEQMGIADTLSDMDAELTALEQRRQKTKLLKQGMMQELLTGKTRLV